MQQIFQVLLLAALGTTFAAETALRRKLQNSSNDSSDYANDNSSSGGVYGYGNSSNGSYDSGDGSNTTYGYGNSSYGYGNSSNGSYDSGDSSNTSYGYGNSSNGSYGYGHSSNTSYGYGNSSNGSYGYGNSSNTSYGYGNSSYHYTTTFSPGFGNDSYPEYCLEMYCWENVYTESGELDYSMTYMQAHTCASFEDGCPCNDKWEIQCEEFGMKNCYPRADGCYDPFAVTCNNETEYLCKNEWSSYCQEKWWGPCPLSCGIDQTYCMSYVYDSEGNPNWTAPMRESCSDTPTCPCDAQWEDKCVDTVYNYSWCTPKVYPCPITCAMDEQVCFHYAYLANGEPDFDSPGTSSCAPMDASCPCDAQWEEKCVDTVYNYSWCTPKAYPCPITCAMDEQYCYQVAYLATGEPDWSLPTNMSCAPMNGSCPCHPVWEELCHTSWGSYCQSKNHGACPLECKDHEHHCYAVPYDEYGNYNYSATWEESCANATIGCPCDATWEHKCTADYGYGGYSWCQSKSDPCPVDCGNRSMCWHHSGNTSCATTTGCICEADETACPDMAGQMICYHKQYLIDWYGSAESCPVNCNWETQMLCTTEGFDASGDLTWTEYCYNVTGTDDWSNWWCPVLCDDGTAKKCAWTDTYSECVPLTESCPEVCTAEQKECWVEDYDTSGNYLNGSDTCAPKNANCPCGQNTQRCTFDGYTYCQSTYYGACPVFCAEDEKRCDAMSFTPEGLFDWTAPIRESCVKLNATCTCGANAKMCKWTNDYGDKEEVCYAEVEPCPESCAAGERRCYLTDHNASGFPVKYYERCAPEGQSCPCGTNSQECLDPVFGESFCYPVVDFWLNEPMQCPVFCSEQQDYCYIPSFDAKGEWLTTTEECVPKGQACDCSRGTNAFSCTWKDELWGSWTECLPTHNGYCPTDCPEGEVACDLVEDFLPNGTALGLSQPSVKCAASLDKCPCGKESTRCPRQGCVFKDEGCAAECGANQKKCYIADYKEDGSFVSDQEICVGENAICKCGKNTVKCANSDLCLPFAEKNLVCPCKASEKSCPVTDFDKDGSITGFSTQCVKEGNPCPCGTNSISCADPNDALSKLCVPSFAHKRCPTPCTVDALLAGNKTCVQNNLDSKGEFKSTTIRCLGANENCGVGEGMKRCPNGAAVAVDTTCVNLYAYAQFAASLNGGGRRMSEVQTAQRQTCNAIITMSSVRSDAKSKAETVRVKMNSVLQMPNTLTTSLAIKESTTTRRLDNFAGRQLSGSTSTMVFLIDNQGVTGSVTPEQVCEQLKQMVKSSNPSLTKAVSAVGVMNSGRSQLGALQHSIEKSKWRSSDIGDNIDICVGDLRDIGNLRDLRNVHDIGKWNYPHVH